MAQLRSSLFFSFSKPAFIGQANVRGRVFHSPTYTRYNHLRAHTLRRQSTLALDSPWSLLSLHINKHLTGYFSWTDCWKSWQAQSCRTERGCINTDQNFRKEDQNYAIRLRPGQLVFGQPSLVLCSLPSLFSRAANRRTAGLFPPFTSLSHALHVQPAKQCEVHTRENVSVQKDKVT